MRPDTSLPGSASNPANPAPRIRPSAELRSEIRSYLDLIDSLDGQTQDEVYLRIHQALMQSLEQGQIPFNSPKQARWIARWIHSGEPVAQGKRTTIMFARKPSQLHVSEYDPICNGVRELVSEPFANVEEERVNAQRFVPVLVTIEPLHPYQASQFPYNFNDRKLT